MSEVEFGPHRVCYHCGKLELQRECVEYDNKFFCCNECKLPHTPDPTDAYDILMGRQQR